jgi:hypothetical protein
MNLPVQYGGLLYAGGNAPLELIQLLYDAWIYQISMMRRCQFLCTLNPSVREFTCMHRWPISDVLALKVAFLLLKTNKCNKRHVQWRR